MHHGRATRSAPWCSRDVHRLDRVDQLPDGEVALEGGVVVVVRAALVPPDGCIELEAVLLDSPDLPGDGGPQLDALAPQLPVTEALPGVVVSCPHEVVHGR